MSTLKRKIVSEQQATARLEALCARAEHCSGELLDKLWRMGIERNTARRIVDSLIDRRFVDDRRFARAYINDKLRFAHWGRRKITLGLMQKRVDRNIIDEAIDHIDRKLYISTLRRVLENKTATLPEDTPLSSHEGRVKLFRHAISRGFESQLVANIIRQIATENH